MAVSTRQAIRTKIIETIQAIAQRDLGFSGPTGNVKAYPLEYHHKERPTTYLMARVDGKQEPRAWAVDVAGSIEWIASENTVQGNYVVRVLGYYEDRQDGEQYLMLQDHADKVWAAIHALDSNLDGVVSRIARTTPLKIGKLQGVKGYELLQGEMTWTVEKRNPVL